MLTQKPSGWTLFRNPDFRLFGAARFLTGIAFQMEAVAVGWFVYDLTKSALALGLVGLASFAPAILGALVTGHVADTYDRRRIAAAAYALLALASGGLTALALVPGSPVWPVYALMIAVGSARAFANPATQALLPTLVPREQFGTAIAWNSSLWQSAAVSGPAVGGLLYALGPAVVFASAGVCFAVAALCVAAIRPGPAAAPRGPVTWSTLLAGLTYIRSQPVVLGAITLDLVAVLLGGATALLPIFAQEVLHVGPLGLGLLRSMPAAGGVAMAVVLAHRPLERRAGPRLLAAVAVFGFATIGFGLSTSLPLSMACLFVTGAADMVSVYVRQSLVQGETPDAMRGRVAAVNTVFIGASNELGEFESGLLAALIGAAPAVVAGGVATVLVAGLWGRLFPALRARDRLIAG
ncbi:MFS transporter [Methylobacterium isbiliense]|jgi:MFS family permease|uniref:Enterobactin exporter EntS n=1 Tax=Methylobacterium isbiliense TaxID=315478 RepID=A0ABQ4S578_9HYPH|nr:MFS transporter [Methylobacterium isbiliense]MDN3623161.1 MFS transporter [Methylobacterium isbiliense]GJD98231.1 Enterobactin exporter EntS [Methylobacterium isbiliense]